MKILVTGNQGYLGHELTYALLAKGHDVIGTDNRLYGHQPLCNIECAGYMPLDVDIRNSLDLSYWLQQVDVVVHLAGIVGDKACELDRNQTIEVNQIATSIIAQLCQLYDKKLIFASSCSVYGEAGDQTFVEPEVWTKNPTYDLPALGSLYAKTKAYSESTIWYNVLDDARYCIFRMGTLYGLSQRMRFDLAINRFVAQACTGEPITIYGGDQWRPWLYIQDAVQAYVQAIENDWQGLYNLASFNMQLGEVGKRIAKIVVDKPDYEYPVITNYENVTDKRSYQADFSKAVKAGFVPMRHKALEAGITPMIEAFKEGRFKDWKDARYDNHAYLKRLNHA